MLKLLDRTYILDQTKPYKMCHASSILPIAQNDLLAVWFAGTVEGSDDVDIWLARREKGVWSKPLKISEEEGIPHWNPVLFRGKDGRILLFYKVGRELKNWYTMVKVSCDEGKTWGKAYEMVPKDYTGRGPVRNKPISLSNGWIVAPGSYEDGIWEAFVDLSKDDGVTWEKRGNIGIEKLTYIEEKVVSSIPVTEQSFKGRGVIQPTLWEGEQGNVHMLLRSSEGFIHRSDSKDYGLTWSWAYPISIPNNNSGIDVISISAKELILACNPIGISWGPRTPLVLMLSRDKGETWEKLYVLEEGEGEYSYPCLRTRDNRLFVSYTWNRTDIACLEFEIM